MTVGPLVFAHAGLGGGERGRRHGHRPPCHARHRLVCGTAVAGGRAGGGACLQWRCSRPWLADLRQAGPRPGGTRFLAGDPAATPRRRCRMDSSQWLRHMLPPNIIAAAADNAIMALVVFAILFGFARHTAACGAARDAASSRAMAEAMVVIVHWVSAARAARRVCTGAGRVGRQAGRRRRGLLLQYAVDGRARSIAIASLAIYVAVGRVSAAASRVVAFAVAVARAGDRSSPPARRALRSRPCRR